MRCILQEPQAVIDATAEYRSAEDQIGMFVRDTYVENPQFLVGATEAYMAYKDWGGKLSQTSFGLELSSRFTKTKHTVGKYRLKIVYEGIGLAE